MRLKANKPQHGMSHARPREMRGLMEGAHMPMRDHSGVSDAKGYKDSPARRNGEHTGKSARGDSSRLPAAAKGNSKGTAPPALKAHPGVRGTPDSHQGDAGRGGTGRIGKHDSYKGKPTKYSEDISHDAFERLGAE
jgi:hypothetical protein